MKKGLKIDRKYIWIAIIAVLILVAVVLLLNYDSRTEEEKLFQDLVDGKVTIEELLERGELPSLGGGDGSNSSCECPGDVVQDQNPGDPPVISSADLFHVLGELMAVGDPYLINQNHSRYDECMDVVDFGVIDVDDLYYILNLLIAVGHPYEIECPKCGDGAINNEGEVCDGSDLAGMSCSSFGYNEGTLGCCEECTSFDLSNCKNVTRTCTDGDGGAYYYAASNVTGASCTTWGPSCCLPGEPCGGGGGGCGGGVGLDSCNGTILNEKICNGNIAGSIDYNCASEGKICENGACVNQTA